MADQLGALVQHADGRTDRWAGDERSSENVPYGLSFSTSIPGGFKDATLTLPRRIDVQYPDLALMDTITIYGPGGQTAWEGRITQLPRTHDAGYSVSVGAVGWSAHLTDDSSLQLIGVDRRPGSWVEPPLNRRIQIVETSGDPYGGDFDASVSAHSIRFDSKTNAQIDINSKTEIWYLAPAGQTIAQLGYKGGERNTGSIEAAALLSSASDAGTASASTALTLDSTLRSATVSTPTRYVWLRAHATANVNKNAANQFSRTYKTLAVYGNHGITQTADPAAAEPNGFLASDLIGYILTTWAPLLNYTTGTNGTVQASSTFIPHFVIDGPTTADVAIAQANAFDLWEWGVWEGKTFFYRPADSSRLTWEARLSEGASLNLEGTQSADVYNGVIVSYTHPDGTQKTVGPTGASTDATDSTLTDTSATNPVNSHGIPRRWAVLDISQPTTQSGAIAIGAAWLAWKTQPQRRGQLTIKPHLPDQQPTLTHPTGGRRPVWQARAGDWVRIADHPTDVARRIIETQYDHDSRTMTMSLDNTAHTLDALLELLGAQLIGVV